MTKPLDEYNLIWVVDETNTPRMVDKDKFEIVETYDPPKVMEIDKMKMSKTNPKGGLFFQDIVSNIKYIRAWRKGRFEEHAMENGRGICGKCIHCGKENVSVTAVCTIGTKRMLQESAKAIAGGKLLLKKLKKLSLSDKALVALFLQRSMHKHY